MTAADAKPLPSVSFDRKDGGEFMPLAAMETTSRYLHLLAHLMVDLADDGVTFADCLCGLRTPLPKWDLHDPPAVPEGFTPPRTGTRWRAGRSRAEVVYTIRVGEADGTADFPSGIGATLTAAGLANDDVLVVYARPGKIRPEAWMPLGRWAATYGRTPVEVAP